MTRFSPRELKLALSSGLLSFPVTHATSDYEFDESGFRNHLQWLSGYGAAAVFPAGGAGEFFALTHADVVNVTKAAVGEAMPGVPVVAPVGYGTSTAVQMAMEAESAGADGIFILPPYLTDVTSEGLTEHIKAVCGATSLGALIYHRGNAKFTAQVVDRLVDECPNLIGFKDGIGDIELLVRIAASHGDRLAIVGGLPTAELYAMPYFELGATSYSSAMFNFIPQWSMDFYAAASARDHESVKKKMEELVLPLSDLRRRRAGYAVSIIKAGLSVIGRDAGPVRPPLANLTSDERAELAQILRGIGVL
jgi:5-dehydro-4-deoxyglucarate dehydratase